MPQNTTERRYDTPEKRDRIAQGQSPHPTFGTDEEAESNASERIGIKWALSAHAAPLETRVLELEEELRRMREAGKWISVEDRLPVETYRGLVPTTIVLCYGKGGRWFTALFADGYFATEDGDECEYVTHWMPLPLPPQEGPNT